MFLYKFSLDFVNLNNNNLTKKNYNFKFYNFNYKVDKNKFNYLNRLIFFRKFLLFSNITYNKFLFLKTFTADTELEKYYDEFSLNFFNTVDDNFVSFCDVDKKFYDITKNLRYYFKNYFYSSSLNHTRFRNKIISLKGKNAPVTLIDFKNKFKNYNYQNIFIFDVLVDVPKIRPIFKDTHYFFYHFYYLNLSKTCYLFNYFNDDIKKKHNFFFFEKYFNKFKNLSNNKNIEQDLFSGSCVKFEKDFFYLNTDYY